MLKRGIFASSSCRDEKILQRHELGTTLQVHPEVFETASHNLTRNHSIRSADDFPPNINPEELEILGIVGVGAFGRALKVRHSNYANTLVLKEVATESKEDEEALVREISLLRRLKHPNILTCIGVVTKDGRICLVTEYVAKGSLHKLLLDFPRRPLNWILRTSFAKDISAGMSYLHENDLIHRDLTTHNCLVRMNNSVVVSDFGLSKIVKQNKLITGENAPQTGTSSTNAEALSCAETKDASVKTVVTDTRKRGSRSRRHTVVGSPYWMAPEMLANKQYDNAVDVYSFGIVLCQLMARCDADSDSIARHPTTMSVQMEQFLAEHSIPLDCPSTLISLATRCVATIPEQRPTFATCLRLLDDCLLQLKTISPLPEDFMKRVSIKLSTPDTSLT